MKNKNIFKTVLTGLMICGLTTILVAKDALDVLDKSRVAGRTFMPVSGQTYVYNTNGDLWMACDDFPGPGVEILFHDTRRAPRCPAPRGQVSGWWEPSRNRARCDPDQLGPGLV